MPRLVKGGKWVFGWVIVGFDRRLAIPPDAGLEYGFRPGRGVLFLPGSRRSGGFAVGLESRVNPRFHRRTLARGRIGKDGRILLPPAIETAPGDAVLAARGSGQALGFVARGPIHAEALRHLGIEVFGTVKEKTWNSSARLAGLTPAAKRPGPSRSRPFARTRRIPLP